MHRNPWKPVVLDHVSDHLVAKGLISRTRREDSDTRAHSDKPALLTCSDNTFVGSTPYGNFEAACGDGGWEARVMPQSRALSCTEFPVIRF